METVSNSVQLFMPILELFTIYQWTQCHIQYDYNLKLMFGSKKYFAFQSIRTTTLILVVIRQNLSLSSLLPLYTNTYSLLNYNFDKHQYLL